MDKVPAIIILSILVIIELFTIPYYYTSITEYSIEVEEVISETKLLIDKVVDSKILTDDMVADFNISLASHQSDYVATIRRSRRVVILDTMTPEPTDVVVTYVLVDNIKDYEQGDLITVTVNRIKPSRMQTFASRILGMPLLPTDDISLTARVR